jgi:hypothetical protein
MAQPKWQNLIPPQACEKCAKPYSNDAFESRSVDGDTIWDSNLHRTWCKECEDKYMEERESI